MSRTAQFCRKPTGAMTIVAIFIGLVTFAMALVALPSKLFRTSVDEFPNKEFREIQIKHTIHISVISLVLFFLICVFICGTCSNALWRLHTKERLIVAMIFVIVGTIILTTSSLLLNDVVTHYTEGRLKCGLPRFIHDSFISRTEVDDWKEILKCEFEESTDFDQCICKLEKFLKYKMSVASGALGIFFSGCIFITGATSFFDTK